MVLSTMVLPPTKVGFAAFGEKAQHAKGIKAAMDIISFIMVTIM